MIFERFRVEEDLARIRHANMPEKYLDPAEAKRQKKEKAALEERVGAKDILAMVIAVFSIVLPYVILFIALIAALLFVLSRVF